MPRPPATPRHKLGKPRHEPPPHLLPRDLGLPEPDAHLRVHHLAEGRAVGDPRQDAPERLPVERRGRGPHVVKPGFRDVSGDAGGGFAVGGLIGIAGGGVRGGRGGGGRVEEAGLDGREEDGGAPEGPGLEEEGAVW